MRRALRWVGWLVLVLLAVAIGLFTVSKLMGPSDEQRAALALLEADDPQPEGRNAFALLWLLEYDVPEAQWDAIIQKDAARLAEELARIESGGGISVSQQSVAADRGPHLAPAGNEPAYCQMRNSDCLGAIRANRDAYAQRLQDERKLLARVRSLSGYDHYRMAFQLSPHMPFPRFQSLAISNTASALDFVDGRTDQALEAVCDDVAAWRRVGANADNLLVSMFGMALINGSSGLFAGMLAELPADYPLPASCAVAFNPDAMPADLCQAMRGEYRFAFSALESREALQDSPLGQMGRWLYDPEATRAMLAPTYAHACTQSMRRALIDDTPIVPVPIPGSPWRLECVSNFIGCALARIAAPAYESYAARAQDEQAVLRTVDMVLHLREQAAASGETVAQIVREHGLRPAADTWRVPVFEQASDEIGIPLHGYSDHSEWRIPLPGSKQHD